MADTAKEGVVEGRHDYDDNGKPNRDYYVHGIRLKNYRAPTTQVVIVSFFAFATVGMSSALGGAGGGGLLNTTQSNNANVAVYSTFAALAFFGGTIYNRVGIRICLVFGGFGYACLASAYFLAAHIEDRATAWIVIAGCIEGLSAAMLWTSQGVVTMCYPIESMKGRMFSLFWTIFQLGGVIGSIIPVCLNWNSTAGNLDDGSYIAFIVIMLLGCCIPALLLPSDQVIRSDGSHVYIPEQPTWTSEIKGMLETLRAKWWIVTLFPFFAASNWFYTYQNNDFTVPLFNIRTRSFMGLWSNFFNMVGVWFMGLAMDFPFKHFTNVEVTRQTRARYGLIFLLTSTLTIWGAGWTFARRFERGEKLVLIDLKESSKFAPYLIIRIFWSMYDGAFQAYAYWLMGALANNSRTLSHYSGWYKSIQSAAAAIVWRLDGLEISYRRMYLSTWMILTISVCTTSYVAFTKIENHSMDEPEVVVGKVEGEARDLEIGGDGKEKEGGKVGVSTATDLVG